MKIRNIFTMLMTVMMMRMMTMLVLVLVLLVLKGTGRQRTDYKPSYLQTQFFWSFTTDENKKTIVHDELAL